jgi:hypothetical protein
MGADGEEQQKKEQKEWQNRSVGNGTIVAEYQKMNIRESADVEQ